MVRYAILGPVGLCDGERRVAVGGPRQVALLALLLLNANRAVSSDALIDALWGDLGPQGAVKRLQVAIVRLRRTLDAHIPHDAPALRTVTGGYLLEVGPGEVDAEVFQARAEEGRRALHDGHVAAARELLCDALGMWRGPALADVAYEEFALTEIRRLEELRLAALEARVDAELRLGEHSGLVGELESLMAAHPGREHFAAQLMLALYRCGRQGDALEAYTRAREYLAEELGLEPGPQLTALQRAVFEQDAALDLEAVGTPQPRAGRRDAQRPLALPPALTASARDPFVARRADLERLLASYERVAGGARRLVLLRGEPGIGKTRLAGELAKHAREQGAIVLYGRCDEEALLVQQPFVEALRQYVCACPLDELAAQLQHGSGELRRVVPELADRVPDLPEPLTGDPEGARSRLFEAICSLLCASAQRAPVVLVLDDLHWADRPTLLLLKYLMRYPHEARLMVLGTYRDTELHDEHALSATIAELARERHVEQLELEPLDAAAVSQLVELHAAGAAPALAQLVLEGTEGNAFFVVEVLRHLAETGAIAATTKEVANAALDIPEGVRTVIRQRLARLGSATNRLLAAASVAGRSFELDVLQRLSDLGEDELLDALDAAVRARVIDEVRGAPGRHVFSHALIRDTLYDGLTATRRALLHRRVGCALEEVYAGDLEPRLAELAHHFAGAASTDDRSKAIEYCERAASWATSQLAYEQAVVHYRRALELLDMVPSQRSSARRCELLIAQGEAEREAGDPTYRRTLLSAAALAQALHDADRLARAVLANNRGYASSAEGVDRERVSALRAALEAYDPADSPTHAALLSLLALELLNDHNSRLRDELSDQALAMARRAGQPATLARVMTQSCIARWTPQTVREIQVDLATAAALAARLEDAQLVGLTAYLGAHAAMENGDLQEADRLIARVSAVAAQLRQPVMRWYAAVVSAKRCAISGPPEEAERLAFAALELGRGTSQPDIMLWFLGQLLVARFLQGAIAGGEPALPDLLTIPGSSLPISPDIVPSRSMALLTGAAATAIMSEAGRPEEARAHLGRLVSELEELPRDYTALAIPAFASVACVRLGDAEAAARLHVLLQPHSDRLVNTGASWFGAVEHHLGNLVAAMGRLDEAVARYAGAERLYLALDAHPWVTRLHSDRAAALGAVV